MSAIESLSGVLGDAASIMTPLLLAALGGLFTELSGSLNIALEGFMTVGAFSAVATAGASGSLALGVLAGVASASALGGLYALAALRLRANEFIAGLAANLLAAGLAVTLSDRLYATKGVVSFSLPSLPRLSAPGLESVPLVGGLLFGHDAFAYASWAAVALAGLAIWRTPFGMRLRAAGSSPATIVALGLRPERYRLAAILVSGVACGLAGASLSLGLSAYVPNIASGRGWIALVAIYLGGRRPSGILAACFVFAVADSFSNFAQGFLKVPSDFILALPYVVSLLALVAGTAVRGARGEKMG